MVKTEETSRMARLDTLAGSEMIIVRTWHISIITTLMAFVVLFVFFYTFQPTTLLSSDDFIIGALANSFTRGQTASDEDKDDKTMSDKGRIAIFAWSLGLGVLVGILIHFMLVYLN